MDPGIKLFHPMILTQNSHQLLTLGFMNISIFPKLGIITTRKIPPHQTMVVNGGEAQEKGRYCEQYKFHQIISKSAHVEKIGLLNMARRSDKKSYFFFRRKGIQGAFFHK